MDRAFEERVPVINDMSVRFSLIIAVETKCVKTINRSLYICRYARPTDEKKLWQRSAGRLFHLLIILSFPFESFFRLAITTSNPSLMGRYLLTAFTATRENEHATYSRAYRAVHAITTRARCRMKKKSDWQRTYFTCH